MNSSPYRKTPPRIGIFWIGIALAFCGAGVASAQTVYYYTGNASNTAGNWTQSNSWTSGTIAVTNTSGNYQLRVVNGSNATLIYSAAQGNTTYVTTSRGLLIGSGTTGSLSITGGTFSTSGSTNLQDVLGNSNASGTLSLDGGNFTGSAVGLNMLLNGGATTTANLTINSGTATLPKLEIGSTSTSAGTAIINLNGGTINLTTLTRTSTSANSTFNFNGGNLVVGGSSTTYLQGLTRANIRNGTTTITTAGSATTTPTNFMHPKLAWAFVPDCGLIQVAPGHKLNVPTGAIGSRWQSDRGTDQLDFVNDSCAVLHHQSRKQERSLELTAAHFSSRKVRHCRFRSRPADRLLAPGRWRARALRVWLRDLFGGRSL